MIEPSAIHPVRRSQAGAARQAFSIKAAALLAATGLLTVALVCEPGRAGAAEAPIGLGTAATYSVLGGQTVTNTGPTLLSGDLGVNPGSAITGFPPGIAGGAIHAGDAASGLAQADLVVAYDDTASRAPTAAIAGDLVGQTLDPGVYKSTGPIALSGTLTLDGKGDPNSVFVFQIADTLISATASHVMVLNGAQACHVYWQVASSATLGTASTFEGTIMALTSISVTTTALVHGRALARNGQVSLDNNTFTAPDCAPVLSSPPSSSTPPTSSAPTTSTPASPITAASASTSGRGAVTSGTGTGTGTGGGTPTSAAVIATSAGSNGGTAELAATGASLNSRTLWLAVLGIGLGGGLLLLARRPRPVPLRKH